MKKYINIAFIYGILGICGGVFFTVSLPNSWILWT